MLLLLLRCWRKTASLKQTPATDDRMPIDESSKAPILQSMSIISLCSNASETCVHGASTLDGILKYYRKSPLAVSQPYVCNEHTSITINERTRRRRMSSVLHTDNLNSTCTKRLAFPQPRHVGIQAAYDANYPFFTTQFEGRSRI